jgi:hypothetical protein
MAMSAYLKAGGRSESRAETAPVTPALDNFSPRFVTRIGYPPS